MTDTSNLADAPEPVDDLPLPEPEPRTGSASRRAISAAIRISFIVDS